MFGIVELRFTPRLNGVSWNISKIKTKFMDSGFGGSDLLQNWVLPWTMHHSATKCYRNWFGYVLCNTAYSETNIQRDRQTNKNNQNIICLVEVISTRHES